MVIGVPPLRVPDVGEIAVTVDHWAYKVTFTPGIVKVSPPANA